MSSWWQSSTPSWWSSRGWRGQRWHDDGGWRGWEESHQRDEDRQRRDPDGRDAEPAIPENPLDWCALVGVPPGSVWWPRDAESLASRTHVLAVPWAIPVKNTPGDFMKSWGDVAATFGLKFTIRAMRGAWWREGIPQKTGAKMTLAVTPRFRAGGVTPSMIRSAYDLITGMIEECHEVGCAAGAMDPAAWLDIPATEDQDRDQDEEGDGNGTVKVTMYGVTTVFAKRSRQMVAVRAHTGLHEFVDPLETRPSIVTMESLVPPMVQRGGVPPLTQDEREASVSRPTERSASRESRADRERSRDKHNKLTPSGSRPRSSRPPRSRSRPQQPPKPQSPEAPAAPAEQQAAASSADTAASAAGVAACPSLDGPSPSVGPFPRALEGHPNVIVDFDLQLMERAFESAREAARTIQDHLEEANPNLKSELEKHIASMAAGAPGNPAMIFNPDKSVRVVFCVTTYMRTDQFIGLLYTWAGRIADGLRTDQSGRITYRADCGSDGLQIGFTAPQSLPLAGLAAA